MDLFDPRARPTPPNHPRIDPIGRPNRAKGQGGRNWVEPRDSHRKYADRRHERAIRRPPDPKKSNCPLHRRICLLHTPKNVCNGQIQSMQQTDQSMQWTAAFFLPRNRQTRAKPGLHGLQRHWIARMRADGARPQRERRKLGARPLKGAEFPRIGVSPCKFSSPCTRAGRLRPFRAFCRATDHTACPHPPACHFFPRGGAGASGRGRSRGVAGAAELRAWPKCILASCVM